VEHESSPTLERSRKDTDSCESLPLEILAHYTLTSWEDAESILRQAYDAVEAEDRIEFIRALDDSFTERRPAHRA
jgi:hypothetical protein